MLPRFPRALPVLTGSRILGSRIFPVAAVLLLLPAAAWAGKINPSPEIQEGLRRMYSGDSTGAIAIAHGVQHAQPQHPIGFILEANALWWKIYCAACEVKWNLIDAWGRARLREDELYFALADRAIALAEAEITTRETAEMHVYAGMGYGLKARLYGLRGERLNVARSAVKGRTHFARALQLDPQMGDAYTGMGLYNYLADALSPMAKVMRFFMGIPAGNKQEGIRQLEVAMNTAELSAAEARFYLARNLRNFDQQYQRAADLLQLLTAQYPRNPVFALLLGDVDAKLHRQEKAAASFRDAQKMTIPDPVCAARVAQLTRMALAALNF